MRKLASKKLGSEEARALGAILGWWQEEGKGVGCPEERKKRRKEEGKLGGRGVGK